MTKGFAQRAAMAVVLAVVMVLTTIGLASTVAHATTVVIHNPHNNTIAKGSLAAFHWTITPALTQSETAVFQISKDKAAWKTLRTVDVAAGKASLKTRWRAPDKKVTRYFRLKLGDVVSGILKVHVK